MKTQTMLSLVALTFLTTVLSGCAVIGGIFKTGVGVGIFITVVVVIVIIAIIAKMAGGK